MFIIWERERARRESFQITSVSPPRIYSKTSCNCGRVLPAPEIFSVKILEPLQAHYGRLFIRSGYRSPTLNEFCFKKRLGCAGNENNYAYHIWDVRDKEGYAGAMACVVIPSYVDEYARTGDHKPIADWIYKNIPCSDLEFFKHLCAFNIGWHERARKQPIKNPSMTLDSLSKRMNVSVRTLSRALHGNSSKHK